MYRVLLVDDEPYILEGLKHIISWEEYGLEIAGQATNAGDALTMLKDIHILLTDVKMPEMTGLELIRQAKQMFPEIKAIILSGYDDFEYVKEAVKLGIENYLLKPINRDELASTLANIVDKIEAELYRKIHLNQSMNVIRENILYRLVSGNISREELAQKATLLNIDLDCSSYLVSVFHILSLSEENDVKTDRDKSLWSFSISNICYEIMEGSGLRVAQFADHHGDIIILFYDTQSQLGYKELGRILEKCAEAIARLLHIHVFVTVGAYVDDYELISQSYSQALELQEYQLVFPPNYVAFHTDIREGVNYAQNDVQVDFEVFRNLLASGRQEDISAYVDDIFTRLSGNSNTSPSTVRNLIVELLVHLNSTAKAIKRNSSFNLDYQNLISEFSKRKNLTEIKDWLKQLIFAVLGDLKLPEDKTSPIISQVLKYLNQNYSSDISIKTLAGHFNINAAYLGQLFKKETGEIFSDFLFKFRMEKARQLMSDPSLKANEIALKVGYNEASYFYKSFKKYTRLSFSEYRNLHHRLF